MAEPERCACGLPLHYKDRAIQRLMEDIIAKGGADVPVRVAGKTWLVPMHYLALHRLNADEMLRLGFPEVEDA